MARGVDVHRLFRELFEIGARLRENERSRGIKTTVQIDGTDESFKRIRQCRCPLSAATGFFAASDSAVTSQSVRQQQRIAEFVTAPFLERTHASVFDKSRAR